MAKINLEYFSICDIGLFKKINQDGLIATKNNNGDYLFMVCDGVSSSNKSQISTYETISILESFFKRIEKFNKIEDAYLFLNNSFKFINRKVYELSLNFDEYKDIGCTITGLLFTEFGTICFNAGDSRCYSYDNKLNLLTKDDTYINYLLDTNKNPDDFPDVNIHAITKALGVDRSLVVDYKVVNDYKYYMVCSDGLYFELKDKEIENVFNNYSSCKLICEKLYNLSLLKGGSDNISVIIIKNLCQ